jgi:hypothetical protein
MPVGAREAGTDQKPGAVLHQAVADEAELGLLARPLAVEPGVRVRARGVGLVRALVAVEVRLLRPPPVGGSSDPSLGRKLFIDAQASISVPSTEKCSADTRGCASTGLQHPLGHRHPGHSTPSRTWGSRGGRSPRHRAD